MQRPFFFERVAILGVGLIGASLALGLREQGLAGEITGHGRTEENLRRARAAGIIDDYSLDSRRAVEDADFVVFCTPVGIFRGLALNIAPALKPGSVVTDVGSVKGDLVQEMESLMPESARYVGSHPIAGSDKSGIDDARPDLFKGALCVITPTARSDAEALRIVTALWERLGATVAPMSPRKHDEVYAAVSHLPHVVAYALVNAVEEACPGCVRYAGKGFGDTTRIALSSADLWAEIALFNRGNIIRFSERLRQHLENIEALLGRGDADALRDIFARARGVRMTAPEGMPGICRNLLPSEGFPDSTTADQGL